MSLLAPLQRTNAAALERFSSALRRGSANDRALLQNLQEEDRIPKEKCRAFHAALLNSRRRSWNDRFKEALPAAQRAVPVPTPRPGDIAGNWWSYIPLVALQKFKYVSVALRRVTRAPPRLKLLRRIGRPEQGAGVSFWITDAISSNADDIRDRLGLCFILRGQYLYRISIELDSAPTRILYIPTAIDAGIYPAWRRPDAGHTAACGLTRHLKSGMATERELLALPHETDTLDASYVGRVDTDPSRDYLRARGIT